MPTARREKTSMEEAESLAAPLRYRGWVLDGRSEGELRLQIVMACLAEAAELHEAKRTEEAKRCN